MDLTTIIITVIAGVISAFGAKIGIQKWSQKAAKYAMEGKKYVKEIDDLLTVVGEKFGDGEISTADLAAAFKEGKDIWDLANKVNAKIKPKPEG